MNFIYLTHQSVYRGFLVDVSKLESLLNSILLFKRTIYTRNKFFTINKLFLSLSCRECSKAKNKFVRVSSVKLNRIKIENIVMVCLFCSVKSSYIT